MADAERIGKERVAEDTEYPPGERLSPRFVDGGDFDGVWRSPWCSTGPAGGECARRVRQGKGTGGAEQPSSVPARNPAAPHTQIRATCVSGGVRKRPGGRGGAGEGHRCRVSGRCSRCAVPRYGHSGRGPPRSAGCSAHDRSRTSAAWGAESDARALVVARRVEKGVPGPVRSSHRGVREACAAHCPHGRAPFRRIVGENADKRDACPGGFEVDPARSYRSTALLHRFTREFWPAGSRPAHEQGCRGDQRGRAHQFCGRGELKACLSASIGSVSSKRTSASSAAARRTVAHCVSDSSWTTPRSRRRTHGDGREGRRRP